jgi:hypothetical protein
VLQREEAYSLVDELGNRRSRRRREGDEGSYEGKERPEGLEDVDERVREFREEFEAEEEVKSKMREFREEFEREQSEREASGDDAGDGVSGKIREVSEELDEQYQSEVKEKFESEEPESHEEEEPMEDPEAQASDESEQDEVRTSEHAGGSQATVTVEVETPEEPAEASEEESETQKAETDEPRTEEAGEKVTEDNRAEIESPEVSEDSTEESEKPEAKTTEGERLETEENGEPGEKEGSREVRVESVEETDTPTEAERESRSTDDVTESESTDVEIEVEETEGEREENAEQGQEAGPEQPESAEEVETSDGTESERPTIEHAEESESPDIRPEAEDPEDATEEGKQSQEAESERPETADEDKVREASSAEGREWPERRSRSFPDGDPTRPSMFPETREERLRRILKEEFEKLPEEEKERLREEVKRALRDKKSLRRFLTAYRDVLGGEALEERLKEAEEYIRVQQELEKEVEADLEEIAKRLGMDPERVEELADDANAPDLIQELWNLEIERRWSRMLRYGILHNNPEAVDEIVDLVREDHEISQSLTVEFWCAELRAWAEVMRAAQNHEIPFVMVDGEERYRKISVERLADRLGVSWERVIDWLRGGLPSLIGIGIKQGGFSDIERREDASWIPSCRLEYEVMLERHNHYRDQRNFKTLNKSALAYIGLKELESRRDIEKMTYAEVAKRLSTTKARIGPWVRGQKIARMFKMLGTAEGQRAEYEGNLSPKAFEHRIPPEQVYEHFRHLKAVKRPTVDELSQAIAEVYLSAEHPRRVMWADLRRISYGGPNWLRRIAKVVLREREAIEEELNARLGLADGPECQLRLGVVNDRLYFRLHDTREQNWMHLYREEIFRFRRGSDKRRLIALARERLGLEGNVYLSRLIGQVTDYNRRVSGSQPTADLNSRAPYLKGATLALILDTLGIGPDTIESSLRRIGRHRHGGIENPQFPKDPNAVDLLFAKLFGVGLSDGHVELKQNGFVYTECDPDRVDIVIESVRPLGDVYYQIEIKENGMRRVRFTSVVGRLLIARGFPPGDKGMQETRLPRFIREGDIRLIIEYIRQMLCEDGSFSSYDSRKRASFSVTRATTLRDPSKKGYGLETHITDEQVRFIQEHGIRADDDRFGTRWELAGGTLRHLAESSEAYDVAKKLRVLVYDDRPRLMLDEKSGLEKIGVESHDYLVKVTFFLGSGRVSSEWKLDTTKLNSTMRIALVCPPDDVVKLRAVKEWVRSRPELAKEVADELKREGLPCYYEEMIGDDR